MQLIKMNITNERVKDLQKVAREFSMMGVVAGGAVLDAMLDREAKDIDVFYTDDFNRIKDTFVTTVEANGTVFKTIGDARYTDVAFAMSGEIEMLGSKYQIEIINKNVQNIRDVLLRSFQSLKGMPFSKPYDVDQEDDFFVKQQFTSYHQQKTLGNLELMNRAYGSLLIHEFDLDIKQIMIDPVTLDIMATPAFVQAYTNQTVNFSRALIFGEGVTRRNLVRIADAMNKYDLRLADADTVAPVLEAVRDFHSNFPMQMDDTTLIKRFAKNFGIPFFVENTSVNTYEGMTDMVTDQPVKDFDHITADQLKNHYPEMYSLGIHFFDQWTRSIFRQNGTQIVVNESFTRLNQSLSNEIHLLISVRSHFAGTKFGEFIESLHRAFKLFDRSEMIIKHRLSFFEANIDTVHGIELTNSIAIAFDGYAPCEETFCRLFDARGLKFSIAHTAKTLVTSPRGYVAYTLHSSALLSAYNKLSNEDMHQVYDFSSSVSNKAIMFTLFPGKLSFKNFEAFELKRYTNQLKDRIYPVRTVLTSAVPTLEPIVPTSAQPIRAVIEDMVDMEELEREEKRQKTLYFDATQLLGNAPF